MDNSLCPLKAYSVIKYYFTPGESMPKVSIIMGAYNCEKTIERTVNSIYSQTFSDWEFLICDDASKDGTWNFLEKFAAQDSRIKLLRNEKNLGLAGALNKCILQASGEYLARQDADDYSENTRLAEQVAFLDSNKDVSVVGTYMNLFDESGLSWGVNKPPETPQMSDWVKGSAVIHASVMMRRKTIETVKGYNEQAIRVEDYELWMRMVGHGIIIKTLPKVLYNVHWDASDYSRKRFKQRIIEAKVRLHGYKNMQVPILNYVYVLKPIFTGLVPKDILFLYHKHRYRNRNIGGQPDA
jgi:glycosyltransferase EpsE